MHKKWDPRGIHSNVIIGKPGSNLHTHCLGERLNKLWYINSMESLQKNEVDLYILTKRSLRHTIGEIKASYRITYNMMPFIVKKNVWIMSKYMVKCIERGLEKCTLNQ